MKDQDKLRDFLQTHAPDIPEAPAGEEERIWQAIRARSHHRRWPALLAAAAAALLFTLFFWPKAPVDQNGQIFLSDSELGTFIHDAASVVYNGEETSGEIGEEWILLAEALHES